MSHKLHPHETLIFGVENSELKSVRVFNIDGREAKSFACYDSYEITGLPKGVYIQQRQLYSLKSK